MFLETPRLALRELTQEDLPAVTAVYCDARVTQHMVCGPVNTPQDAKDYLKEALASRREQPRCLWELAVLLRESGEVIGTAGIEITNAHHREGEIGYVLSRDHWGQGYATEAARALVEFGFRNLGLHRIWAVCAPANQASARVLEKCGMAYEGHLRGNRLRKDGTWRDSLLYAILEGEYGPR